nr:hypothetical protein [Paraburkholderia sp. BL10I2N1]
MVAHDPGRRAQHVGVRRDLYDESQIFFGVIPRVPGVVSRRVGKHFGVVRQQMEFRNNVNARDLHVEGFRRANRHANSLTGEC